MVLAVIRTYRKAVQLWGLKRTLEKMYSMGEIKFGTKVGTDNVGNEYYENTTGEYGFGMHRWVEYKDIHNFDSSTIPAAWHGWLHHQHDEPPTEQFPAPPNLTISASSRDDSPYHNHFGLKHKDIPEGNKSVYRPVGYGYGNLYQKWGEKEGFYKAPGNLIHPRYRSGRDTGMIEAFNPKGTESETDTKKPLRDLNEV